MPSRNRAREAKKYGPPVKLQPETLVIHYAGQPITLQLKPLSDSARQKSVFYEVTSYAFGSNRRYLGGVLMDKKTRTYAKTWNLQFDYANSPHKFTHSSMEDVCRLLVHEAFVSKVQEDAR